MSIGKLEVVPLRDIWKHEEHKFTVWLESNLNALSETLGITLSVVERERRVGAFKVDLVARDDDSRIVVIENQLEPTDHDHLGKILTYLTNLDAKTAIWLTADQRPEHIRAMQWLNEVTPIDISFYLIKVTAYRIGDSDPAPLFTVIIGPSAEGKAIGQEKKGMADRELGERHVLRRNFWAHLLTRARDKGLMLHANISPSHDNWISAQKSRIGYNYTIWLRDKTAAEVYIDKGNAERNKQIFDDLYAHKAEIEQKFGGVLEWDRLEQARGSRIRHMIYAGGIKDEDEWPQIADAMIDGMNRLYNAVSPHLDHK